MIRYSRPLEDGNNYFIPEDRIVRIPAGYTGEPINRLAAYENLQQDLLNDLEKISQEMAGLREEGKIKSVHFKELMSQKMINTRIISLFQSYGLE
ncbi:MAG: hypothetical protein KBG27_09350 [Flexilinea sp.]|jgi:hypothetical protein|nr:hypothetical protein [Flexilinea sp.]HPL56962.1 hypothetical protein [Flexilinea sp.]